MDYNDYFERGIAFYRNYEYGPALENLREALKLNDNPKLRGIIEKMEAAAAANARKNNAAQLERQFRGLDS